MILLKKLKTIINKFMNNLRVVNLVLLILYITYSIYLIEGGMKYTSGPGVSGILLMFLWPIYIAILLIFISAILSLLKSAIFGKITIDKADIFKSISVFLGCFMIIAYSLFLDWDIVPKIIGVIIILLSAYKIYTETQLLNNKRNQNSDVLNSENNNLYQNTISNSNPQPTDTYTYTQSTIPTPEVQNTYQQASMNNTPRVTFDTQSLSNQHNTSPSSITESIKEIQDEYKSNQNPEESLAQKIQNHYQNNVNSQKTKIVSEPNPNKFRNLFFSVLLILGFLAFAFLSLGGIIVGDLTISGVLAVGSFILVIDGYLFYLMWFKK